MLDDIIADDIAQGIRIPIPATQDRLLPPWARIACGLRAHPTGLALLISEQTFQKQASILRNTLLPEQRTYPLLDLPKRRRPQRKRLFNRRCLRPRCSNHGCPWIQKTSQMATVMLGAGRSGAISNLTMAFSASSGNSALADRYIRTARSRSALPTTLTDESAIAAAAMIGERSRPNVG